MPLPVSFSCGISCLRDGAVLTGAGSAKHSAAVGAFGGGHAALGSGGGAGVAIAGQEMNGFHQILGGGGGLGGAGWGANEVECGLHAECCGRHDPLH